MDNLRHYLLLHFIVLIWGFSGILGMLISIPAVEVVFYRTGISAILLFGFIFFSNRRLGQSGSKGVISQFLTGTLIAAHWVLFFQSARLSNVSICLAGMSTCALWTSLLEPLFFRRRLYPVDVLLSFLAVVGMAIVFQVEFEYWRGLVLAILSAFIASVFTIINGQFIQQGKDAFVITFYEMTGAALIILLFLPFYSEWNEGINLSLEGWDFLWIGLLAIVCTVYAYSVSVKIMTHITPFVMNLTVNLEPVYGIVLAVLIFGAKEEMSAGFYAGTGLVLVSVLAYPVIHRINRTRKLPKKSPVL